MTTLPKQEGRLGEEVLGRHLFKYEQGVPSNHHRSAFRPRLLIHNLRVHILKLRKPDHPSGRQANEINFSHLPSFTREQE